MLTIAPPPRSRITGAAACVHRNIDSRLSRNIACHSSSEISASGWSGKFWPALLIEDVDRSEPVVGLGEEIASTPASVVELGADRDRCAAGRRDRRRPRVSRPAGPGGSARPRSPRPSRTASRSRPRSPATPRSRSRRDRSGRAGRADAGRRSHAGAVCGPTAPASGTLTPDAARGIPPQARLREDARSRRRPPRRRAGPVPDRPVRRPAPPRHPAPLRLPARDRRRPRVVGRPQGPDPRPDDPPHGRPRRGPPDRVLRLRGRHPGQAVRRRRRHRLGLGHLGAGGADARRRDRPSPDGELKFVLHGQKVKGRFTIVRTSGRRRKGDDPAARAFEDDEGEQWLLIHKRGADAVKPAGTPRTTRRASRPAAPTTRSRPTATRSGSARRRPPPPRST